MQGRGVDMAKVQHSPLPATPKEERQSEQTDTTITQGDVHGDQASWARFAKPGDSLEIPLQLDSDSPSCQGERYATGEGKGIKLR